MEVVKALSGSLLIERLVESHNVRVRIACIFEVVVDTVGTEEHQDINQCLSVLIRAIGILCRNERAPVACAAACRPALKELDTRHDVRTVAVGGIYPAAGSLEYAVIP